MSSFALSSDSKDDTPVAARGGAQELPVEGDCGGDVDAAEGARQRIEDAHAISVNRGKDDKPIARRRGTAELVDRADRVRDVDAAEA